MGAKSITIVRAVTVDFFFDCRAAAVPSDECIKDIPAGVHNRAQDLRFGIVPEFQCWRWKQCPRVVYRRSRWVWTCITMIKGFQSVGILLTTFLRTLGDLY
jgi:hypothetical protein